jgi:hypothetical protein
MGKIHPGKPGLVAGLSLSGARPRENSTLSGVISHRRRHSDALNIFPECSDHHTSPTRKQGRRNATASYFFCLSPAPNLFGGAQHQNSRVRFASQ